MDDDGIEVGKPVPIKVRVVVKGDEMTVDLTNVSKQVRGFYNSGITTGHACAQVAYKCLTSPTDYPINDGSFRSLKVIVPPGRIVSAMRPAPMRWWMTYPMTIVDTMFKALAPVIPDRVIAGHHADLLVAIAARHQSEDVGVLHRQFRSARRRLGRQAQRGRRRPTVCINDGDTHNSPNEQAEAKFPLVVERYALVPDSGGAGRRRGGLGVERVVRAAHPDDVQHPGRARPLQALGARQAAAKAPATRWRFGLAANGRPISPTPRCWWRRSRRTTPSAFVPAAVAAMATRFERADRGSRRGRAAGLCVAQGGGRALWRRDRPGYVCGRSCGHRAATRRGARSRSQRVTLAHLAERDQPLLRFIPQRQPHAHETLQQRQAADIAQVREVAQHARQPVIRDAA